MKKLFFVFLMLLLLLYGCSGTDDIPEEKSKEFFAPEIIEIEEEKGMSTEEPADPKPEENLSTEKPQKEEIPVMSAEGPIVYTPKAGEKPKQLLGHIASEFYICRSGRKEAVGLTADEAAVILALLESADENGLWGDPYDDLPDYELWFADGRMLTYTSSSGIFTNGSAQKAFMISDADRENLSALFKSAVKRATGED